MQAPSHADAMMRRIAGPTGLLGGRYRPLEVLGQGGMGVVFQAIDERLQRDVAIKAIRADLVTPEFTTRFFAEATALSRIHHPNVIQILDVAEPGSPTAYYVMELVQGTPLSRLLREQGRLPWSQACDLLTQIASALAAVHTAGVVHRDLKPSNVLCVKTGRESWHAELIDFGIAIAPGLPRLTRPGEMLGTLPYMAPEQFTGGGIDRRTDVYGWGVLALELLGGVQPSELFGDTSLAGAPLRDRAPAVLERARVRPDVATIVERCLATRPDDRWPDMETVHGALADLDGDRGLTLIFERPGSRPKTGTMLAVRSRRSKLAIAGVVLATIGPGVWFAHRWGWRDGGHTDRVDTAMHAWPAIVIAESVESAPAVQTAAASAASEARPELPAEPRLEQVTAIVTEQPTQSTARARTAAPRRNAERRETRAAADAPRSDTAPKPAPPPPPASQSDEAAPKAPFVRDPFAK